MQLNRLNLASAVLSLTMVLGIGCSDKGTEAKGSAQIGVQVQALQVDVQAITLTVSPGTGTPSFNPISQSASKSNDGLWTAYISDIPAGTGRVFDVIACDVAICDATTPAANRIYVGQAIADIITGQTAQVYVVLQQTAPPNNFNNHVPVINSLTASASTVTPGTTVNLSVTATDQENRISGYLWQATCGTLTNPTSTTPTWTAPSPSQDQDCTISVTVSDFCDPAQPAACNSSVTASLQVRVRNVTTGNANVEIYPNTCPMVSCVAGAQRFLYDQAGAVIGYEVDMEITSADTDGDQLRYVWSSVGCPGAVFTPTGANPTAQITDDGTAATRRVRFTSNTVNACDIRVDVRDFWPNGTPPAGSNLSPERGCLNQGFLSLGSARNFRISPTIVRSVQPNAGNQVAPGQPYTFGVDVRDDNVEPGAYPLQITYTASAGTFANGQATTNDNLPSAGQSRIVWTAPTPLQPGMTLTVQVRNQFGLITEKVFTIVPSNQCALTPGAACDDGNACTSGTVCQADGSCGGGQILTCPAAGICQEAGSCNPASGQCEYPNSAPGTSCNADSNGCTQNDACNGQGTCVAGPAPACNSPANPICRDPNGVCASTGNNSFQCNYAITAGAACPSSAAADKCFNSFTCTPNGACQGVTADPVNCATGECVTGATCVPATGLCSGGSPRPDGTACTGSDICQLYSCQTGNCLGAPKCGPDQSCDTQGVCRDVLPVIQSIRNSSPTGGDPVGLSSFILGGIDFIGSNTIIGGGLADPRFDGTTVTYAGDRDLVLARYTDANTLAWARVYGDAARQEATGVGVLGSGNIAALLIAEPGVINGKANNRIYAVNGVTVVSGTDGTPVWTRLVDQGTSANGLEAIATHPARNDIAVCGNVDGTQAILAGDAPLVPAYTPAGPGDLRDAVVAVLNGADGSIKWVRRLAGAGSDTCKAIEMDAAGNVYAVGQYSIDLDFGPGGSPVDPTTRPNKMWAARFAAADGATQINQWYGIAGTTTPNAITLDSAGKLWVTGSFAAQTGATGLSFGGTTSPLNASGTDMFVAKLDPASSPAFQGMFSGRMGGTGSDVGLTIAAGPSNSVLVGGVHFGNAATTGLAALSAGASTQNGFLLKLGSSGVVQFAATYGQGGTTGVINERGEKVGINGSAFVFGVSFSASTAAPSTLNLGGSEVPPQPRGAPTLNVGGFPGVALGFGSFQ